MPITKNQVSYKLNLKDLLEDVPKDDREDAAYEAGEVALEKIHDYMDRELSPVKGQGSFKGLSKEYKEFKKTKVGNTDPNLRLTGRLIESMDVDADDKSFTISVEGKQNIGKAHNHNTDASKRSPLPKRQFLPNDRNGESLKRDVVKAIKETINKYKQPTKQEEPRDLVPQVDAAKEYLKLFTAFRATKRETAIAKNIDLFDIEDIL